MSWWQESGVMVVIGHFMRVALIGVDGTYDVIMCMAMIFDPGLMLRDNVRNRNGIMSQASHIRRQNDAHRQNDGQPKVGECPCLSFPLRYPQI